jgi:CRP-like cAMP-binding protein
LLLRAFLEAPFVSVPRGQAVKADDKLNDPQIFLIHRGMVYWSSSLEDGKRAILDILLPGDFAGIDRVVMGRPTHEMISAELLTYRAMSVGAVRGLMADRTISLRIMSLIGETCRRMERHVATVCTLEARERIAVFLLDIYDRLHRRDLINRSTFYLPLTQEQIADHLGLTSVHVSRTLSALRKDGLIIVDRHVVIVLELERLREMVSGLPALADLSARAATHARDQV